jgi:hypothetical protein
MGILALHLWGGGASRDLLAACLAHDLGESVTGDIPWGAKQDYILRTLVADMEDKALAQMGMAFDLTADDARRLKYLDRLDAYLWAEHHRPDIVTRPDWVAARHWLITEWTDLERIAA